MSKLVIAKSQVDRNIPRFARQLKESVALQGRVSYARAWYGRRNGDGSWSFGPSKFIGYQEMTAIEYLNEDHRDGRRTEKQLAQWYAEVPIGTPLYEELSAELFGFLALYGKVPSTKMRISIAKELYEELLPTVNGEDQAIVDLILRIARTLPKSELDRLRKSL